MGEIIKRQKTSVRDIRNAQFLKWRRRSGTIISAIFQKAVQGSNRDDTKRIFGKGGMELPGSFRDSFPSQYRKLVIQKCWRYIPRWIKTYKRYGDRLLPYFPSLSVISLPMENMAAACLRTVYTFLSNGEYNASTFELPISYIARGKLSGIIRTVSFLPFPIFFWCHPGSILKQL